MLKNRTGISIAVISASAACLIGCASSERLPERGVAFEVVDPLETHPRSAAIFCGRTGAPMTFQGLIDRAATNDVVILGEQHNDGIGHFVQREVVVALGQQSPSMALAMEMLERDEQIIVDDFLEGIIDEETFVRLTGSASWAGDGSWAKWYQPIIDAARSAGAPVIAANAPRRYVRLARLEGFERLAALPPDRRRLVAWPESLDVGPYRDRFFDFMGAEDPEDERAISFFRSQMTWDATMADSVVRTLEEGFGPVVLLIGQFHSDFDGGTIVELRARREGVRILNVSLQPVESAVLRDEDENRADIVVYTRRSAG